MGTLLPPSTLLTRRIRLPFADAMLLLAVIVSGGVAGAFSHPAIWVATPFVSLAVWLACRQRPDASEANDAPVAFEWPEPLWRKISTVMETLQPGNAQRRFDTLLRQAKPMFTNRATAPVSAHALAVQANVSELVAGACDVVTELAQLDGVSTQSPRSAYPELSERYEIACNMLETWLDDAAKAIDAAHAAGAERSSRASERVAALAERLRHDAASRSAANAELLAVLKTL